jgi:hypothetical protein
MLWRYLEKINLKNQMRFTPTQNQELENAYATGQSITQKQATALAAKMGLDGKQVSIS